MICGVPFIIYSPYLAIISLNSSDCANPSKTAALLIPLFNCSIQYALPPASEALSIKTKYRVSTYLSLLVFFAVYSGDKKNSFATCSGVLVFSLILFAQSSKPAGSLGLSIAIVYRRSTNWPAPVAVASSSMVPLLIP